MAKANYLLWGSLGTIGIVFLWDQIAESQLPESRCSGPREPDLTRQLAVKWGSVFGAPVSVLMVLARIESGWRPNCVNVTPRAILRGGAWGLVQQTLNTAIGHVAALKKSAHPTVIATLKKWNGTGKCLLDPDLNMMLAARQVGALAGEFGDSISLIAAGYHQGASKVRQMLRDGKAIPEQLPPNGKIYVTSALKYDAEIYA